MVPELVPILVVPHLPYTNYTMSQDAAKLTTIIDSLDGRDLWNLVNVVWVGWIPLYLLPTWTHTPTVALGAALSPRSTLFP